MPQKNKKFGQNLGANGEIWPKFGGGGGHHEACAALVVVLQAAGAQERSLQVPHTKKFGENLGPKFEIWASKFGQNKKKYVLSPNREGTCTVMCMRGLKNAR